MKYYFTLQLKLLSRHIEEYGLTLGLATILFLFLIAALYTTALRYPQYAGYAFSYLEIRLLFMFSTRQHVGFLKTIFNKQTFLKIRVIELMVISIPLLVVSAAASLWWCTVFLLAIIPLFAMWNGSENGMRPIWTPFSKSPFEFIILIRKYWPIYVFFYMLAGIGIYVSNLSLSIVALSLTALIGTNAYEITEPRSLLRNYTMPIHQFLRHKIQRGIYQAWITVLLPSVAIGIAFPSAILYILIVWGYIALAIPSLILMKYSIYPRKILIIEGLIFAILMLIPFLLLAALPYYYQTARKNLKLHGQ